ncbi:MAG TPA: glutamate-5-semialdehyde dehydrogenase [Firmicutes bacterium]|nr:MAG: glutamate-5-semialdehyde dehydrogenase [Candidatus Omnitrophota bacterium]HDD64826.1 glutamate-5-semialdehyde dehydrogenase [Bacillota bacterium]
MEWKNRLEEMVKKTKQAFYKISSLPTDKKNEFLQILADKLILYKDEIIKNNRIDVEKAKKQEYSKAFIDRLLLTPERVEKMVNSVKNVKDLPDPVGKKIWETVRPNGLKIERIRVPIGVICIIYESRPDVTIETSILCLKSGNCVILKGGKEAINSNKILVSIIKESLEECGIPSEAVNLVDIGGRRAVRYLLKLDNYIDLIIPRGGESLIREVTEKSRIPVIKHYKGICHTYVDKDADLEKAWKVTFNAKVQRPGTCNATETLLVHKDIAKKFLPEMAEMFKKAGVEMRGCDETRKIIKGIKKATESDWKTEYLDMIISIKIVNSLEEAISHINKYGSGHSDAIITENKDAVKKFFQEVDSAALYHNASTRFTDGGEFGLGAEIGISTDKIHARGPMGLEELTIYKYLVYGNGQTRK